MSAGRKGGGRERECGDGGMRRLRSLLLETGGLRAALPSPARAARDSEASGGGAAALDTASGGGAAALDTASAPGNGFNNGADSDERASSAARIASAGPRAEGRRGEYELLIEAIYEGYLLHYGSPRLLRAAERDLAVLAGDRLYALGLARLVALGDIDAVAELADTITLSALAQGERREELAEAIWEAGARAIGWGSSEAHARAKKLVREGSAGALEAMRTSALHPGA